MRQTLNFKIYQDLYNKIRSHFYKPGEQLPTESALAERYSTSLSPIRQALGKLESEQLIVRMPGKGTFVSSSLPWENMLLMSGFGVHFIDKKVDSDSVHCQTLKCCKKAMDEQQYSVFKTDPAKLFTYVARVRYVDGKPLFFLNHYFEKPEPEEVLATGEIKSIRSFLSKHGLKTAYVQERVKAVAADKELGNLFSVPFGFPLLKIVRKELNENYEPIIFGEYYVNSDVWDYRVQYSAGEL